MHVLAYWLARIALMFAVFVALWGLGWTPWFAVLAAALIAWLISYAMFGAMHDAAAQQMERWVSRRFVGVAGDEAAEDAEARIVRTPAGGAKSGASKTAASKTGASKRGTAASSKAGIAAPSKPAGARAAKPRTPAKRSV